MSPAVTSTHGDNLYLSFVSTCTDCFYTQSERTHSGIYSEADIEPVE